MREKILISSILIVLSLTMFLTVFPVFASAKLVYSKNETTPLSPGVYSSQNTSFSVTMNASDNTEVVFQLGNYSATYPNVSTNYTRCSSGGRIACIWNDSTTVFYINFTTAAFASARLLNFSWFVNDSVTGGSTSNASHYMLDKGVLFMNTSGYNATYGSLVVYGVRGANNVDADVTYNLWRNNSATADNYLLAASGLGISGNLTDKTNPGVGVYNYTFNATGGANWTANDTGVPFRKFIYVFQNTTTFNFMNLTLDRNEINVTIEPYAITNVTGSYSSAAFMGQTVTFTLYRDALTIETDNPITERTSLGANNYLYIYNTSGNANFSAAQKAINFTVKSPSTATSVTPSGGGTVGTSLANNIYQTTFSSIIPDSPKVLHEFQLSVTNTGLTQVDISVTDRVTSVTVSVQGAEQPSGTSQPANAVYNYFSISAPTLAESNVASIGIQFKVPKSWLVQNSMDSSHVALYRLVNNAWTQLATTKTSEDSTYAYYSATSPGLSYYAVGFAGAGAAQQTTTTSTRTTQTTTATQPATGTTTTTIQPSGTAMPTTMIVGVVLIFVVIIALLFVVQHMKKPKQKS